MYRTSAEDAEDEDREAGDEEPTASAGKAGAAKKKRKEKLFKVSAAVLAWKVNVRAWQVKPQARSDETDAAAGLRQDAHLPSVGASVDDLYNTLMACEEGSKQELRTVAYLLDLPDGCDAERQ